MPSTCQMMPKVAPPARVRIFHRHQADGFVQQPSFLQRASKFLHMHRGSLLLALPPRSAVSRQGVKQAARPQTWPRRRRGPSIRHPRRPNKRGHPTNPTSKTKQGNLRQNGVIRSNPRYNGAIQGKRANPRQNGAIRGKTGQSEATPPRKNI